ncbi:MAG: hypothetical protein AMXMBFR33_44560 [Candidatus Xenobia bacterium]
MLDRVSLKGPTITDRVAFLGKLQADGTRPLDEVVFSQDGTRAFLKDAEGLVSVAPDGTRQVLCPWQKDRSPMGAPFELPGGGVAFFRGGSSTVRDLTAVGADGSPLWSVPVERDAPDRARFLQDRVLLCGDQCVKAVSLQNGKLLWAHDIPRFSTLSSTPDGHLLVGDDQQVYSLTPEGERQDLPLQLPPDQRCIALTATGDGALLIQHSQELRCYNPDGSVRWSRPGYGERVPVGEGPGVYYQVQDHTLQGLDPATGESKWTVDGYSLRRSYHLDPEGRVRFVPLQPFGELWTVDPRGGVLVQKLPKEAGAPDQIAIQPDGSTLLISFGKVVPLAPPEAGASKGEFELLQEATERVTGLSREQLSHLEPEEWRPLMERARALLLQRRNAEDRALASRASCSEATRPFDQEHQQLKELYSQCELTRPAREGLLAVWGQHHAVEGWERRLFGEKVTPEQRSWLYQSASDLIHGPRVERLSELPEATLRLACEEMLGPPGRETDNPALLLDACHRASEQSPWQRRRALEVLAKLDRSADASLFADLISTKDFVERVDKLLTQPFPTCQVPVALKILAGQDPGPVQAGSEQESLALARLAGLEPKALEQLWPALQVSQKGQTARELQDLCPTNPAVATTVLGQSDEQNAVQLTESLLRSGRLRSDESARVGAYLVARRLESGAELVGVGRELLDETGEPAWLGGALTGFLEAASARGVIGLNALLQSQSPRPVAELRPLVSEAVARAETSKLHAPEQSGGVARLGSNLVVGNVALRTRSRS